MNHNGTNRVTPFFSKKNYLIYFWDFSSKFPQSPPNVRNIRYLLLKIRNFLQKNGRNRFTTAEPVHNGEPVRAVVVQLTTRKIVFPLQFVHRFRKGRWYGMYSLMYYQASFMGLVFVVRAEIHLEGDTEVDGM